MSNIPVIDMIFAILIVLMVIHGYVKGLIEEVFSWAPIVLAMWAAVFFHPSGAAFIRTKILKDVRYLPEILAFIAIFLLVMILLKMLERVLKDVVMGSKLGGVDKILGLVFGLVEGVTLSALILFVLRVQPFFDAGKILADSVFAELLLPLIAVPLERGKDAINTAFLTLPGLPRFQA